MADLSNADLPQRLAEGLEGWRRAVGESHVIVDESALEAAATATFATTQRASAIVQPADRPQLERCLEIANTHRVPVYPVSCGKNWGYGSRVPVQDGSVIFDLGRMNRILEFNEQLAYVTVEPGVTQQQLFDFLAEKNSQMMMSVTGSSPDSSIIGNVVERGIGVGRYCDRWNHVCAMEVLLPTGECIHTGFDRFERAAARHVSRDGVGPWLDGLFTQSRFGIVTRLTMWLYPRPKHFQVFLCWMRDEARLERFIECARTLRLEGTVDSTLAAFNDFRTLTFTRKYPWEAAAGATPLPSELRKTMVRQGRAIRFMALGTLYSPSWAQARAARKRVRQVMRGNVDKLFFVDRTITRIARWIRHPYRWLSGIDLATYMDSMYHRSAYLGFPIDEGIASMYWRKKTPTPPAPQDLDRDRCGVVFFGEVVPCEGRHVVRAVHLIEETILEHGFEPVVNLSAITERTIHIVTVILYDREEPGEDGRAAACHDDVVSKLAAEGYLPYRLGVNSMQSLPPARDDFDKLIRSLRETLDPNNILAPGRYE